MLAFCTFWIFILLTWLLLAFADWAVALIHAVFQLIAAGLTGGWSLSRTWVSCAICGHAATMISTSDQMLALRAGFWGVRDACPLFTSWLWTATVIPTWGQYLAIGAILLRIYWAEPLAFFNKTTAFSVTINSSLAKRARRSWRGFTWLRYAIGIKKTAAFTYFCLQFKACSTLGYNNIGWTKHSRTIISNFAAGARFLSQICALWASGSYW